MKEVEGETADDGQIGFSVSLTSSHLVIIESYLARDRCFSEDTDVVIALAALMLPSDIFCQCN